MEAYKKEVTRLRSNDKTFLSYNSEREKYGNDSESSILKKKNST